MRSTRARVAVLLAAVAVLAPAGAASATHPVAIGCTGDRGRVVSLVELETEAASTPSYGVVLTALDTRCGLLHRVRTDGGSTPSLNRDGRRVAVDLRHADGRRAIHVLDDEYHRNDAVTDPPVVDGVPGRDDAPAWSPDGRTLLFTRTVGRTSALFTVADPGRTSDFSAPPIPAAQQVPGTEDAASGSWSPDGTQIVYAARADTTSPYGALVQAGALVVSAADGSQRRELGVQGLDPVWSPDGSTIAFSTVTDPGHPPMDPSTRRIALVAPTGGEVTVLQATGETGAARRPAWFPDSQSLIYSQERSGLDGRAEEGALWVVDRTGLRAGAWQDAPRDERNPSVAAPVTAPAQADAGTASTYSAIAPRRVLDTRSGRAVGAGGTVDVPVTGAACAGCAVVPADATAVALTVTAVGATRSTDVRAYPAGSAAPHASNLNATRGETVANAVLVPVGRDGRVTLANSAGEVHLLADVAGYFSASAGSGFAAVPPRRVLDTRREGNVGAPSARLGPAGTLDLQVVGALPHADGGTVEVPQDATAVVLNVTATGASATTDVRAYPTPAGGAVPVVSNLNLRRGQTAASLVTVAVGDGGRVRLRNAAGSVDLVADLAGYYAPSAPGRFVPARPLRVLDTRIGTGAAQLMTGAGELLDLALAGRRGIPSSATGVALNLTGTGATAGTDVRAYPAGGGEVPTVSNLNLAASTTRANLAVVPLGPDGALRLRNAAGSVSLVADLAGWFVPAG